MTPQAFRRLAEKMLEDENPKAYRQLKNNPETLTAVLESAAAVHQSSLEDGLEMLLNKRADNPTKFPADSMLMHHREIEREALNQTLEHLRAITL